ncbi:MAG TPA: metallophosphoesterase [Chitinophagales bacterium]|nr:metallophosphoesterase [Chitinophagales bacterium]
MLQQILFFSIVLTLYGTIEYYGWQAIRTAFQPQNIVKAKWLYWGISAALFILFASYRPLLYKYLPKSVATYFALLFVIILLSKLVVLLFLFPEDIVRFFRFVAGKFSSSPPAEGGISRSEFLSKAALLVATIPAATLIYGVLVNAYNYQFKRVTIKFPNLPDAFNGFKIIQLSDIHSGSFTRTEPIEKVIKKINESNADLILFTGDLVNNVTSEMEPFMNVFNKLQAKNGVLSVTGNHDYGDYVPWDTPEAKQENFDRFVATHKNLGWDLLLNENRILERDGQKIAIIGIENWGGGHFAKYGKFDVAYKGTEDVPFKILMSHDPSSWDNRVRKEYPETDLTLSGHTHGAQFGVENKWLKWSPSQYIYKQWAGLYNEGKQYLYVNRGFGFLFYPGRVGILPEVTEITLQKG